MAIAPNQNPVAVPNAQNNTNPTIATNVNNLTTPGGGYVSEDAAVRERVKAMSAAAEAQSSLAKAQPVAPAQPYNVSPPVTNAPVQTTYQSVYQDNSAIQRQQAVENAAIAARPPGTVYDSATNTYRDPLDRTMWAGNATGKVDAQGREIMSTEAPTSTGLRFTTDEANALKPQFDVKNIYENYKPAPTISASDRALMESATSNIEKGILTTDNYRAAKYTTGNVLSNLDSNPLPHSNLPTLTADERYEVDTANFSDDQKLIWSNLNAEIDRVKAMKDDPTLDPIYKFLTEKSAQLDKIRQENIEDIHASAKAQYDSQLIANQKAEGMTRTLIGVMGWSPTMSTQALALMKDTLSDNERALATIADAERKAVREANQAFMENDMNLTLKKIEQAESHRTNYLDLLEKSVSLKQSFDDAWMKKTEFIYNLRKQEKADATEDMGNWASAGIDSTDVPEDKLMAWSKQLMGVADIEAGKKLFDVAAKNKALEQAKTAAETQKAFYDSIEAQIKAAQNIPEGQTMTFDIGGKTFSIDGMKDVSKDWKATEIQTPDGKYLIYTDQAGNKKNTVKLGDNYVAPHYNANRNSWETYNPITNTTSTVFNNGEYSEGMTALSSSTDIVEYLVGLGGTITQEPGMGTTHGKMTGWDVAIPSGTPVNIPFENALVVARGDFGLRITQATGSMNDYGNYVDIMDVNSGARIRLAHFSNIPENVKVGSVLNKGSLVGLSGNTGLALGKTGNHVHVEALNADGSHVRPNQTPQLAQAYMPKEATAETSVTKEDAQTIKEFESSRGGVKYDPQDARDRAALQTYKSYAVREKKADLQMATQVLNTAGFKNDLVIKQAMNSDTMFTRMDSAMTALKSDTAQKGISDFELIDAFVQFARAGGQITENQVNLLQQSGTPVDVLTQYWNKFVPSQGSDAPSGGILSPAQRESLWTLAQENYKLMRENYENRIDNYYKPMLDAAGVKFDLKKVSPLQFKNVSEAGSTSGYQTIDTLLSSGKVSQSQLEQAREAGWSDEEIEAYLNQ